MGTGPGRERLVLLRGDVWKVRLSNEARGRSPLMTGERPEMSWCCVLVGTLLQERSTARGDGRDLRMIACRSRTTRVRC